MHSQDGLVCSDFPLVEFTNSLVHGYCGKNSPGTSGVLEIVCLKTMKLSLWQLVCARLEKTRIIFQS